MQVYSFSFKMYSSRYVDDIFTIDSEFAKHIPDIYPTELQLNKANT